MEIITCQVRILNESIHFFNVKELRIKSSITNISKPQNCCENLIMITKDLLFILGRNQISIINVNYYKIVRIVEVPNSSLIHGACMLNKNMILLHLLILME